MRCNQMCRWNDPSDGCVKPDWAKCSLSNMASPEKPKTNADRIQAMSYEELEDLFREVYNAGCDDATAWECGIRQNTFIWNEEWFQQPSEGD